MTGLLAVIAAIVGGVIALLVGTRQKSNAQLTTADGKLLRWPKASLPLFLIYPPHDPELQAAVSAGANLWNLVAGSTLFITTEQPDATVTGGPGMVLVSRLAGAAGHTRLQHGPDGEILTAPVTIDTKVPAELLRRVVAHELGHVLGEDHSVSPRDVMYPRALPGPFEVSAATRIALKSVYGSTV